MRTRIAAGMLLIMLFCASCGQVPINNTSPKTELAATTNAAVTTTAAEETEKQIRIGETVIVDDVMEVTLDYIFVAEEIILSRTGENGMFYYSLNDKPDEKYLIISARVKNLAVKALEVSPCIRAHSLINNKYEDTMTVTTGRGLDESVKSLQTLRFYIYVSLSDELSGIIESVKVDISLLSDEKHVDDSILTMPSNVSRQNYIFEAGINDFKEDPDTVK